jgi:predicted metalloendopeptidase
MIYEEDWLSEETKAAAIDKLDNMVVQVVRPSNTADYSDVVVKSYDEGGTILDAAASAARLVGAHMAERASDPDIDREFWDIYDKEFSTTTINCFYRPERNSIYIMAGFVAIGDDLFGEDMTDEEFIGSVGAVAGHEISHGFDSKGSHYDLYGRRYDDEGKETDWMNTEDRSRLDERAEHVGSYFSLARPIPGQAQVEGGRIMNEATADMAGIKAVLYMARDIEGFDYDSFFRGYAALYATQTEEKFEVEAIEDDEHPLDFHRVNITLQQFDEFLDTYDIKPGDGMYLDPDKRINVW